MQVSVLADQITNATMGGKEAVGMKVSASSEFFHILSTSLYQNAPRAALRETLCNAWDSHIQARRTDVPIEVELFDKYVSIKDTGTGIPHDRIEDIYFVCGNSTKTSDANQTGGFGLGCKAPFSVADTFTVINIHGGVKKIYSMQKNCEELGGIPGMKEMVSISSIEHPGLTVQIPTNNMTSRVDDYIIELLKFNTISANYTNHRKDTKHEFRADNCSHYRITSISESYLQVAGIQYGSVIYPMPAKFAQHTYDNPVKDLPFSVILIAEPNSLAVTPSRECLIDNDKTITYLCNRFDAMIKELRLLVPDEASQKDMHALNVVVKDNITSMVRLLLDSNRPEKWPYLLRHTCRYKKMSSMYMFYAAIQSGKIKFSEESVIRTILNATPKEHKFYNFLKLWDAYGYTRAKYMINRSLQKLLSPLHGENIEKLSKRRISHSLRIGFTKKQVGSLTDGIRVPRDTDTEDLMMKIRATGFYGEISVFTPEPERKPKTQSTTPRTTKPWHKTTEGYTNLKNYKNGKWHCDNDNPSRTKNPKYFLCVDPKNRDIHRHDSSIVLPKAVWESMPEKLLNETVLISRSSISSALMAGMNYIGEKEILEIINHVFKPDEFKFYQYVRHCMSRGILLKYKNLANALGLPKSFSNESEFTTKFNIVNGLYDMWPYNLPVVNWFKKEELSNELNHFDSVYDSLTSLNLSETAFEAVLQNIIKHYKKEHK